MKLLELEVDKKSYIKILCACILFVIILLVLTYISLLKYEKLTLDQDTIIANIGEENMSVHVDSLEHQGNKVEIVGWAYKENEETKTINSNYVLKNKETGEMYKVRTRYQENLNVPLEYRNAGLHSRFLSYGLSSGTYDIYVLYRNNDNNILANTGIHLDN